MARKPLTVTVKVDIYFHVRFEEVNTIMFFRNENSYILIRCLKIVSAWMIEGHIYVGESTSAGGLDQRWFVNVDMF